MHSVIIALQLTPVTCCWANTTDGLYSTLLGSLLPLPTWTLHTMSDTVEHWFFNPDQSFRIPPEPSGNEDFNFFCWLNGELDELSKVQHLFSLWLFFTWHGLISFYCFSLMCQNQLGVRSIWVGIRSRRLCIGMKALSSTNKPIWRTLLRGDWERRFFEYRQSSGRWDDTGDGTTWDDAS